MPEPSAHVRATRLLLHDVCALLAVYGDDAVLVGGWVPEVRFPDAYPAHVGSIDVDMALRLDREAHAKVVQLLLGNGFRRGTTPYQFWKDVPLVDDRSIPVRLDLLTSQEHHMRAFATQTSAPFPIPAAEIAFRDNTLETLGIPDGAQIRVAGIVAFLVMKCFALANRERPKDAYDLHFCLENYPHGLEALAREFDPLRFDPMVLEALTKLAAKFRSEEDEGPRCVVEVEGLMGDARAIRKLAVYIRVNDFLRALEAITENSPH
jgi:hypothetical protein